MKVRIQMNLLVVIMVVAFVVAIGGLLVATSVADTMEDLRYEARVALLDVYRLTDDNNLLLLAEQPIDSLTEDWQNSVSELSSALEQLQNHPGVRFSSARLREDLNRSLSVWELSRERLTEADRLLAEVLDDEQIPFFRKTGLLQFEDWLIESGEHPEMLDQVRELQRLLRSFALTARDIVVGNLEVVSEQATQQADRIGGRSMAAVAGLGAFAVLIAVGIAVQIGRKLTSRVSEVESAMTAVAEKDLAIRSQVRGNDEIAHLSSSLNRSLDAFGEFVGSVRGAVEQANELKDGLSSGTTESASALNEISQNIASLTQEFEKLQAAVDQTWSATNEINERIQTLNGDISTQNTVVGEASSAIEAMSSSIRDVAHLARQRRESADTLVQTILEGGEKIQSTNEKIDAVTAEVDDILEIIEIINAVSEQTNLLSMNAAIESAHAGEAGKGFAVVAEEIRKLAESTSENASQIDRLLKSITGTMREAREASQASAGIFDSVTSEVELFRTAMNDITGNMATLEDGSQSIVETTRKVSEITTSVSGAAREIAQSSEKINQDMESAGSMSFVISNGMVEIDHGAKEVLGALTEISSLSDTNKERMDRISLLLADYRLETQEHADADGDGN